MKLDMYMRVYMVYSNTTFSFRLNPELSRTLHLLVPICPAKIDQSGITLWPNQPSIRIPSPLGIRPSPCL